MSPFGRKLAKLSKLSPETPKELPPAGKLADGANSASVGGLDEDEDEEVETSEGTSSHEDESSLCRRTEVLRGYTVDVRSGDDPWALTTPAKENCDGE